MSRKITLLLRHICRGHMVHYGTILEISFHSWGMMSCEWAHPHVTWARLHAYGPISMEIDSLKWYRQLRPFLSFAGMMELIGVSEALKSPAVIRSAYTFYLIDTVDKQTHTSLFHSVHTLAHTYICTHAGNDIAESSTVYVWIFVFQHCADSERITIERYMCFTPCVSWKSKVDWFWAAVSWFFVTPHRDINAHNWPLCRTWNHLSIIFFAVWYFIIFFQNDSNLNTSWTSYGVWGLSGCGSGSHEELVWPDPLHCFHSKGCWVCSLHIYPSCQLFVCVEPARPPVFSLSELNPIRQKCVRNGHGLAQLCSALPAQPNATPSWWLSPTNTGHLPTKLTSACPYLWVKGFHCNRLAKILPSLSLSKPHLPPCLLSAFLFSPHCISLPWQSVCSAYCAPCEQRVMPVNWWNQSLRLSQAGVYTGNYLQKNVCD